MIIIPSTDKKRSLKAAVFLEWKNRVPALTKKQAFSELSRRFGLSVSTVKRYVEECSKNGSIPAVKTERRGRKLYAWSSEAIEFFKMFLYAANDQAGHCTVRNAYRNTKIMASEKGWSVGSEPSAYLYAKEINPVLLQYARGGQRALDNMFYIARNLQTLRPFQVVVGDQHRFDYWVSDQGGGYFRPECYLWLDMRTRLVYGVSFDHSYNTRTVLRSLKMGVSRFGKFECTYNDNGTSEKSAVADDVVDRLLNYGMKFEDESEMYRAKDGYIIEDEDGNMLDVVQTRSEWQRRHRRIFARVKNAKTKPIERFFSTLEQLLQDRCLPGIIKPLAAPAPEEEKAQKRLDWQKKNGFIMSYEDFCREVGIAINTYEHRLHATLGRSPLEELEHAVHKEGWRATMIPESDLFYLFTEHSCAVVQGDRVRLGNTDYVGPNITREMVLQNRGTLVGLNRKKVELRYDPDQLERGVWAIDPRDGNAIALRPVEKIEFFDERAGEKLEWKKSNMKAIEDTHKEMMSSPMRLLVDKSAFKNLREASTLAAKAVQLQPGTAQIELENSCNPASNTRSKPVTGTAQTSKDETLSDDAFAAAVAASIAGEEQLRIRRKAIFPTERDRYESIIEAFLTGSTITEDDLLFKVRYEADFTDEDRLYFESLIRMNAEKRSM